MQDIPSVPFKSNQHILKYTASARYAEHVDGATFTNIICTVIDRVRGQQHFFFTREWICCPHPAASGHRSVRGSNKTAVAREVSL